MKFVLVLIFTLYFFFFSNNVLATSQKNTDAKVKYYETIINKTIANSQNYTFPKGNKEFKVGIDSNSIIDYGKFDFIIVGAGSAGAILAARLSENRNWNILLLEAGEDANDFSLIPSYTENLQQSNFNWGYLTTSQNNSCLAMNDNKCSAPRGKLAGGSNGINGMLYVRGNKEDYNRWGELNEGWSYNEILRYFRKTENSQIDGDVGYHGVKGLWNIGYNGPLSPIVDNLHEACREQQINILADYNGKEQIGVSRFQSSIKDGQRYSTVRAFLSNSSKRKNFYVSLTSLVTSIIFNNKKATGVIFVHDDKKYQANVRKEVIVAAGTYNSPQLLMLSGIGPQDHLKEKGIKVVEDLPVGQNLVEHPYFIGLKFQTNYTKENNSLDENIRQYLNGYGPLTISSNLESVGFIPPANGSQDVPVIEYLFEPITTSESLFYKMGNIKQDLVNVYGEESKTLQFGIFLSLLHENSRGTVTLKSNNSYDFPDISYNLYTDEKNEDIQTMIYGIKFILKLIDTKGFRKINATLIDLPVCSDIKKYTDSYWECALRHFSITVYHPSGTNKMAAREQGGVVDNAGKVHGVRNLRVVDASVIPVTISGHTNAPTVMAAEKISDDIKIQYKSLNNVCI